MLSICIFLIVLIMFLALFLHSNRKRLMKGGYILPFSFKRPSQESAVNTYTHIANGDIDGFCKSIAQYFFTDNGVVPEKARYREDGNILSINEFIEKVYTGTGEHKLKPEKTFMPDFTISNDDKLLIVEFDEKGHYHQSNQNNEYIAKNLIYDEILCSSYKERKRIDVPNVCVLRIKYNEKTINKTRYNLITANKVQATKIIIALILYTWNHMAPKYDSRLYFHNQYILGSLEITSELDIKLKEFISLKPRRYEDMLEFSTDKPCYSGYDLDTRKSILTDMTFEVVTEDLLPEYNRYFKEGFNGSEYQRFLLSKKRLDITNNPFNGIIDHFN